MNSDQATSEARKPVGQYVGRCAFCGRAGKLTKEHIWGRWSSKYLGTPVMTGTHMVREINGGVSRGSQNRPGAFRAKTLRVVCRSCNNGWMKDLNERAEPSLAKLAIDDWWNLSLAERQYVAAWGVMFSMLWEFCDYKTMATTSMERKRFMKLGCAPANWMVGLGRYDGLGRYNEGVHHTALIAHDGVGDEPVIPNIQVTTFTFSKLIIHTHSTQLSVVPLWWDDLPIVQIWPVQNSKIEVPNVVGDEGFLLIAHSAELLSFGKMPPSEIL